MLCYDRIYLNEGTDPAKSNNSKKCIVCHCCFFNHVFKFQDYVCNGCHDLAMLCLDLSDTTIITIKSVDYYCIMHGICKSVC